MIKWIWSKPVYLSKCEDINKPKYGINMKRLVTNFPVLQPEGSLRWQHSTVKCSMEEDQLLFSCRLLLTLYIRRQNIVCTRRPYHPSQTSGFAALFIVYPERWRETTGSAETTAPIYQIISPHNADDKQAGMQQLGDHRKAFREILYWIFFKYNLSTKFNFR